MKRVIAILFLVWVAVSITGINQSQAEITATTETIASQLITDQGGWNTLAAFASASGVPLDLAVGKRTLSTIRAAIIQDDTQDGQIVIYGPLNAGANVMRVRNMGLAAAGDHVYHVYSGALGSAQSECAFVKRGTLTFKTGSQASINAGYEYADLLTVTNVSASASGWVVANPGDGTELVAEAYIDLQGDNYIVIVPTTLDDNSIFEGKFY